MRDIVYFCFLKNTFYGSIVALQCCVSCYSTAKMKQLNVHICPPFFWISFPYRSPQSLVRELLKELLREWGQLMPSICWIYV